MTTNRPIPTKFDEGEDAMIRLLAKTSGLKIAQVIRRCVRLMGQEVKRRGEGWDWVRATAETLPPPMAKAHPVDIGGPTQNDAHRKTGTG